MDTEFVVLLRENSKRRKCHSLLKKGKLIARSVYHNNIIIMEEKSPYQRGELNCISDKGDSFYINHYDVKLLLSVLYQYVKVSFTQVRTI